MKKLTPEQVFPYRRLVAKWSEEAGELLYNDNPIAGAECSSLQHCAGELERQLDTDEAKPGNEEHCLGCLWWVCVKHYYGREPGYDWVRKCRHPDFKPGYCPEGRWEDDQADT